MGKNIYPVPLTYHQLFFPSFFGLTSIFDNKSIFILKLTIRVFSFLALQVKTSVLSVRFFMTMAKLNNGTIENPNATLKVK